MGTVMGRWAEVSPGFPTQNLEGFFSLSLHFAKNRPRGEKSKSHPAIESPVIVPAPGSQPLGSFLLAGSGPLPEILLAQPCPFCSGDPASEGGRAPVDGAI